MHTSNALKLYYGDLHNHCAVGYGHGSLDDAFYNARLQLDFAAVTVHAHWPDIPVEEARLAALVDYHRRGFKKSSEAWPDVQETVATNNEPGRFITFLGFEWHSRHYGDHNIYFNGSDGEIIRAATLADMRQALRRWQARGTDTLLLPHHIGYSRATGASTGKPSVRNSARSSKLCRCTARLKAPTPHIRICTLWGRETGRALTSTA
jgi:hypothetical protein